MQSLFFIERKSLFCVHAQGVPLPLPSSEGLLPRHWNACAGAEGRAAPSALPRAPSGSQCKVLDPELKSSHGTG